MFLQDVSLISFIFVPFQIRSGLRNECFEGDFTRCEGQFSFLPRLNLESIKSRNSSL